LLLRIATLMTKAALVTFGGAYAVLPYVVDAMVNQGGWISAGQAVDALAFGETDWDAAVAAGRVRASGTRADLRELLPLAGGSRVDRGGHHENRRVFGTESV
jgi:hypothetical protein